jgi:hypothetical protein
MGETKWQSFNSIVRSIAVYGGFLLILSEVLRSRTSGRGYGRARFAELLTSVGDLLGLQDVGPGQANRRMFF